MLDWLYDTLGVSIEFNSDWTNPYPFRVIEVSSQHDDDFGQWELTLAILGLSLDFVWVYDEGTEARQVVKERFADDSWLSGSMVTMTWECYQDMKRDQDELRAIKGQQ